MSLSEAMEKTIEECISQNILRDFLVEQKSEVVAMSIYEYNEEYVMRVTYEEGENAGYKKGLVHNIEAAMKNLGLSLEKACEVLEISMEEYQKAKAENSQEN